MLKKHWSSVKYPSSTCMTTGFGPFELLTGGLLQKGWDHSPAKFCFCEEPSFLVGTAIAMGIYSAINIQITKQIGGGVNGWSYCNIN